MARAAKTTALVIEDDGALRYLISNHLKNLGCRTTAVGSGSAAQAELESSHYDVVVADVHLPDGNAIDLVHAVHQQEPELPVVFITGDTDGKLADQAMAENAAALLIKPFEFTELTTIVQYLTAKHQAVRALSPGLGRAVRFGSVLPLLQSPAPDHARGMSARLKFRLTAMVLILVALSWWIGTRLVPELAEKPMWVEAPQPSKTNIIVVTTPSNQSSVVRPERSD